MCSSVARDPAAITDIASSTITGTLDITRTTGTPSGRCFSTNEVLIPAALGGMIHEGNADRINTRLMIEGANSPTTPAADEILQEKGVYVIPDVMANAGGVVCSYFEWVQNLQHFRWSEREVNDKLGGVMRRAYRDVDARSKEERISLREGAYLVGIERVVEASRTRGYV